MALASVYETHPQDPTVAVESGVFQDHPEAAFYLGVIASPGIIYKPREYQAARRLRANVYIDEKHFLPEEARQRDGGESDVDDARSVHFAVIENRGNSELPRVVGTSRLILKRDGSDRLPVENLFPEAFGPSPAPDSSAEVSRYIARHSERSKQKAVSLALIRAMTAWTLTETRQPVYSIVERPMVRLFDAIELPYEQISDPKMLPEYNTENMAIELDPEAVFHSVRAEKHLAAAAMQAFFQKAEGNGGLGYFNENFGERLT
ncbi:MAG TPA: GNAT family N-acyltransferase [Candidatus Saccharimonadales bacterium]|nr:GNAT family N-acyltransferase [Candidatus Saccharimonadales bacterium]